MAIQVDDIKIKYVPIREARQMPGLRIVLGAFAVPGPWHEACKGIYHVKGLAYTPVRSANEGASDAAIGIGGSQSQLIEWTAQSSAPVVVWENERPRSLWNDQLYLAERLSPEPPLIPADPGDRVRMFGLANELMGEDGLLYNKRHFMTAVPLASLPQDSPEREFYAFLGEKYGYREGILETASSRIVDILELLNAQLAGQYAQGRRYLVGERLSALDIYWAAACGFLDPMPEDRCPMATSFRQRHLYGCVNDDIERALTPALRTHRDFIYETHLQLPLVF